MHFATDVLRTFAAAAETGNFTRAGEAVNRTQSAVSMQIKRLESAVGVPLFERNGGPGGALLTDKGEELLDYARRLLALHDETVAAMSRPAVQGRVRLGVPGDFADVLLPQVLNRFCRAHPEARVDVACVPGEQLGAMLEAGELDLLVRSDFEPVGRGEILRREALNWIASRSSLAHERDPVPLALYGKSCTYGLRALQALENAGKAYRVAFTSPTTSGIYAAVRAGQAVAVVGASTLTDDVLTLGIADGYPVLPHAAVSLHHGPEASGETTAKMAEYLREAFREET